MPGLAHHQHDGMPPMLTLHPILHHHTATPAVSISSHRSGDHYQVTHIYLHIHTFFHPCTNGMYHSFRSVSTAYYLQSFPTEKKLSMK